MSSEFTHLHVASSFSMRYGASSPAALVERAVANGQPRLALTDRDGLYGAVRFVQACQQAGVDPVLGVDLAVRAPREHQLPPRAAPRRTPAKGGVNREVDHPRVTVLARGAQMAGQGQGWAALCRLVSAVHLAGERGQPVADEADLVRAVTATTTVGSRRDERDGRASEGIAVPVRWWCSWGRGPMSVGHCWSGAPITPENCCSDGVPGFPMKLCGSRSSRTRAHPAGWPQWTMRRRCGRCPWTAVSRRC